MNLSKEEENVNKRRWIQARLEKCRCQQQEMITQSEIPWDVIERDCILMPSRDAGNKVYLSPLVCTAARLSLMQFADNAVLITQSFYFPPITILLEQFSVRHCLGARFQRMQSYQRGCARSNNDRCIQHFSFSYRADISYVAFVFHSHISSATLTTSSAEYSGHGECPVSRNRPTTEMVPRNRIYHHKRSNRKSLMQMDW